MTSPTSSPRYILRVDRSLCAGHAMCGMRAPEIYELDDEGFCISDGRKVSEDELDRARLGARSCPEGAIKIEEDY
ncbi:MAG: ferredoxin [Paracoccaceae bacterium]